MKTSKPQALFCPYCHGRVVLRPASYVLGEKATADGYVYVCSNYPEKCDAYVRADPRTRRPMGTLANGPLRSKRLRAHQVFDRIWKSGIMSRDGAYRWLCLQLGLTRAQAHIGIFSDYYCEQVVAYSMQLLKNNRWRIAV